jgi:hypothetical protein
VKGRLSQRNDKGRKASSEEGINYEPSTPQRERDFRAIFGARAEIFAGRLSSEFRVAGEM